FAGHFSFLLAVRAIPFQGRQRPQPPPSRQSPEEIMRRVGTLLVAALAVALADGAGTAGAQEPPIVKATRKKLQEKITIDLKEVGTKAFLDEIKLEMNNPVGFKIDNGTGVSNNSKMTLKAKDQTVEKILNDLADKYDWGWIVYHNPKDANDRYNGFVVIRKS